MLVFDTVIGKRLSAAAQTKSCLPLTENDETFFIFGILPLAYPES
jgi:hypothetical protein